MKTYLLLVLFGVPPDQAFLATFVLVPAVAMAVTVVVLLLAWLVEKLP